MEQREEVEWFSFEMERVLRENDWKSGWQDMGFSSLLNRIEEEFNELEEVLGRSLEGDFRSSILMKRDADLIIKEAVDIANFCMFVARRALDYK